MKQTKVFHDVQLANREHESNKKYDVKVTVMSNPVEKRSEKSRVINFDLEARCGSWSAKGEYAVTITKEDGKVKIERKKLNYHQEMLPPGADSDLVNCYGILRDFPNHQNFCPDKKDELQAEEGEIDFFF